MKDQDEELEDINANKLSGEERAVFETISKLALEKTILNKQVIDEEDGVYIYKEKTARSHRLD